MEYNSDNIKDMISTLKDYGYTYTKYEHKNGECTINTKLLLEIIEKQIEEEGMHLVNLITIVSGKTAIEKLIYTNAPDFVIRNIFEEIKKDGILDYKNKINGILDVLKARGYKYKTVDNMPKFEFIES